MAIARVGLGKAKITSSASSGEISRSALSTTKCVRLPSSHSTCRTFTEPRIIAVSSLIARARPDGQVQLHLLRFPPPSPPPPPPAPNTSRLARGQILPRGSDIAARVSEATVRCTHSVPEKVGPRILVGGEIPRSGGWAASRACWSFSEETSAFPREWLSRAGTARHTGVADHHAGSGRRRVEPRVALGSVMDVKRVRLLEAAHRALSVGGLLQERFRIPLAAGDAEEVAAVDVDRAGQAWNGIGHRVDDLVPEGRGVLLAQRPRAHRFHLASEAARHAAPEDVVLATRVDPDDGPHSVIVGQQGHPRRPDDVQDGEIAGPVEVPELGSPWLSQSAQDRGRLRHRSRDDLADRDRKSTR